MAAQPPRRSVPWDEDDDVRMNQFGLAIEALIASNGQAAAAAVAAATPANPARPRQVLPPLDKYDGKPEDLEAWLLSADAKIRIDGEAIGPAFAQFHYLLACLSQPLRKSLLSFAKVPSNQTPQALVTRLEQSYGVPNASRKAQQSLFDIKQRQGETFAQFILRYEEPAVYIFPETETVVLLLSNAVAINDGPDWIGHLIIQTLFDDPVKHDYVALARDTLSFGLSSYERIENEFKAELQNKTASAPKPLRSYVGKYYNQMKTFYMDITIKGDDELWLNLQGNAVENYRLRHHDGDEFSWHMPRNEQVKRGRNPITYMEYWKIKFDCGTESTAQRIFWVIERDLPGAGMELTKEAPTASEEH